jgi:glycosyltransferase involved in cell wall biosynthesis
VIMPVLNAERFIGAAIASVQAQTFDDWELLVVDDGSTDASARIVVDAQRGDPRIRLVDNRAGPAHGAAVARNIGIAQAEGDLVAFLDADDLYEPDKLADEVELLAAHPEAAMVYGPALWWRDGDESWSWTEPMHREAGRLHMPTSLLRRVIVSGDGQVPCTCSVLIRREALVRVGGFEERFRLYEDQTLWVKLFLSFPVYVHDSCHARYRQHSDSTSAMAARAGEYAQHENHAARGAFLSWVDHYCNSAGVNDPRLRRAIRVARSPYIENQGFQHRLDLARVATKHHLRKLRARAARLAKSLRGFGRKRWEDPSSRTARSSRRP